MKSQRDQSTLWKALSNPIRRELIIFIGEKGVVSFTEIRDHFGLKVGTLYHHLDTLGELITQNESKLYLLSEKGKRAFALIEEDLDITASKYPYFGRYSVLHKLFFQPLISFISGDPIRSLGFSMLVLVGLLVGYYYLSIASVFVFTSLVSPNYYAPIVSFASIIITTFLVEFFIRLLFGKKEGFLALFQTIVFVQVPLFLFSLIQYFSSSDAYPYYPWDMQPWLFAILLLVQLFYLGCLVEAVIVIKNLRLEKAGFAVLFVSYFTNTVGIYIINLFGG